MNKKYFPKAIRGQRFPGHVKVSRAQVKRLFANGQTFSGFIVGCNVSSFHFFGGWHLAFPISKDNLTAFEQTLNEWTWYNANPETGNTPAIYWKKPSRVSVMPPAAPLLIG